VFRSSAASSGESTSCASASASASASGDPGARVGLSCTVRGRASTPKRPVLEGVPVPASGLVLSVSVVGRLRGGVSGSGRLLMLWVPKFFAWQDLLRGA
jgi:hypothetical protein